MATKLGICNTALTLIGADEIASFDDGTPEANVAARLYPSIVNDVASRHPWRFLSPQVQLALLPDAPDARWASAYQIPTDVELIRAVTVYDEPIPFDRYGDKILCDADENDTVILDYTMKVDDSEQFWPGYFAAIIEYELASALAVPIGDRTDLVGDFAKRAGMKFGQAKTADSQGRTTRKLRTSRFRNARNGGRG